jgi:hypothetical protein
MMEVLEPISSAVNVYRELRLQADRSGSRIFVLELIRRRLCFRFALSHTADHSRARVFAFEAIGLAPLAAFELPRAANLVLSTIEVVVAGPEDHLLCVSDSSRTADESAAVTFVATQCHPVLKSLTA